VEVDYASEFRYRDPILDDRTVLFVVSQSGETADTLAALREGKEKGATALGICNVVGSTIARESAGGVYLHAGPEIGVASTKAFTSQLAVLSLIAAWMGELRGGPKAKIRRLVKGLREIPSLAGRMIEARAQVEDCLELFDGWDDSLYLARGYNYPVALEGALKLKEISYLHAEGYPAAEMKHGPIALITRGMPNVIIAPKDATHGKVLANIEEVKARRGAVIAIASEGDKEAPKLADRVITVPRVYAPLLPFLTVIPLQLLAYHVAVNRGCDVDQPRNLAKSVTVE
jgi:glucosamine--fructose-6-phosphate aminotransferase (isomerizing)